MGCDIHGFVPDGYGGIVSKVPSNRNYTLFAVLANVRNYDAFTPIAEPRGIPSDFARAKYQDDLGDHSFSWLSIREILDWPGWDQKVMRTRYVDRAEYERLKAAHETAPQSWCGSSWGPALIHTTLAEVEAGTAPPNWTDITDYTWQVNLREECATFWKWLEWLKDELVYELNPQRENEGHGPRLFFGFDN